MAYRIAEIGFNHGGDPKLATDMIMAATNAGANAVKFQSFHASELYFPDHELYPVFKAGELSEDAHKTLKSVADDLGVDFFSTLFSIHWVDALESINVAGYKIASMDLNNPVLQHAIANKGRPVYLSTGSSNLDNIKLAVTCLKGGGATDIRVFHCISNYPTKPEDACLCMMDSLALEMGDGVTIGFSDHTLGNSVPLAVAAKGAKYIEKHFTTDKNLPGPDHSLSADPVQLNKLSKVLKDTDLATRIDESKLNKDHPDAKAKPLMRRGIYASMDIKEGQIITLDKLALTRPEVTPLERLNEFIDQPAKHSCRVGELL